MSKVEVRLLIDGHWLGLAHVKKDEDITRLIEEVRKTLVSLEKEQAHRDYKKIDSLSQSDRKESI